VPEEYQAESSAKGGSRLICVIPSEGGEIDSTGRSQLKIATVRRGLMSGAGGCRITAARNVRTRQRAGRIKLKGLPGIVTRSRDGTFLISRSWCQRKGSFIEPQCEGQAEFDIAAKSASKEQAKPYYLLCNGEGSKFGICSEKRRLLGSRNLEAYWLPSYNPLLFICFGPLYWFRSLCTLFD